MIKVMYTFDTCAPTEDEARQRLNFDRHLELLSKLSDDGVNSLNIAILGVARFIISLFPLNATNTKRYADEFSRVFFDSESIDKNTIAKDNSMCLVERVNDNNTYYYRPSRYWQIDTNLAKAKFMRKVTRFKLSDIDKGIIKSFYNIDSCPTYMIGGADETDIHEFVKSYNHYLYEFYRRSESIDQNIIDVYDERRTGIPLPYVFDTREFDINAKFTIDVSMFSSLYNNYFEIDDICDSVKFYTRRIYELNFKETTLLTGDYRGKKHYTQKLKLWDRYLRIYDLHKEYIDQGKKITPLRQDLIGKKIVNEFNIFTSYSSNDLRKEIVKGYKEAQRLIEESKEGYL